MNYQKINYYLEQGKNFASRQEALNFASEKKSCLLPGEVNELRKLISDHFGGNSQELTTETNAFLANKKSITSSKGYKFPKFKFICRDLGLLAGPPATLIGESGGSKTAIASLLCLCVASGNDFLGMAVTKGKALWLDYEQGADLVEAKFMRLMNGHQIELEDGQLSFTMPQKKLDDPDAEKELVEATRGIDFAVIDCLRGSSSIDENDSSARDPLDMLRNVSEETKCTFLVIHHSGKKNHEEARGSSALKDAVSTSLVVTKEVNKKTNQKIYKLGQLKTRQDDFKGIHYYFEDIGEKNADINMTEAVIIHSLDIDAEINFTPSAVEKKIFHFLTGKKMNGTELFDVVGGNKTKYLDALQNLQDKEVIKCVKDGKTNWYSINKDNEKCGEMDWTSGIIEEK